LVIGGIVIAIRSSDEPVAQISGGKAIAQTVRPGSIESGIGDPTTKEMEDLLVKQNIKKAEEATKRGRSSIDTIIGQVEEDKEQNKKLSLGDNTQGSDPFGGLATGKEYGSSGSDDDLDDGSLFVDSGTLGSNSQVGGSSVVGEKIYVTDESGRRYWTDINGKRHYLADNSDNLADGEIKYIDENGNTYQLDNGGNKIYPSNNKGPDGDGRIILTDAEGKKYWIDDRGQKHFVDTNSINDGDQRTFFTDDQGRKYWIDQNGKKHLVDAQGQDGDGRTYFFDEKGRSLTLVERNRGKWEEEIIPQLKARLEHKEWICNFNEFSLADVFTYYNLMWGAKKEYKLSGYDDPIIRAYMKRCRDRISVKKALSDKNEFKKLTKYESKSNI